MILNEISAQTGVPVTTLRALVRSAHHRYKTYRIPKRTGGQRVIHHPSKEIKFLQRWISEKFFSKLPVHNACWSYVKGRNIRGHADRHRKNRYLVRIDLVDFFSSIKFEDVYDFLRASQRRKELMFNDEDVYICSKIATRNGRLTIGSPSSPSISNSIMYDFDCHMAEFCRTNGIAYTRYADDIYFSTNRKNSLGEVPQEVQRYLRTWTGPKLKINQNKTIFTSKKRRRVVTGLNITPSSKLSIGRKQKRRIKSFIYLYKNGDRNQKKIEYLRGYLNFVQGIEPDFITRLRKKYGKNIIETIRATAGRQA